MTDLVARVSHVTSPARTMRLSPPQVQRLVELTGDRRQRTRLFGVRLLVSACSSCVRRCLPCPV